MDDQYLQKLLEQLDRQAERNRAGSSSSVAENGAAPRRQAESAAETNPASSADAALASLRERLNSQVTQPSSIPAHAPPTSSVHSPAAISSPAGAAFADNRVRSSGSAERSSAPVGSPAASIASAGPRTESNFVPRVPHSWADAGLKETDVEALALKLLLSQGALSGRDIAESLRLPFSLVSPLLANLKAGQWLVHKGTASLGDYVFQLAPSGVDSARHWKERSKYCGPAPVALDDYIVSVKAQSVIDQRPDAQRLNAVFQDLTVNAKLQNQIGQAVYGGLGFFLFGAAGNGKTSLGERVSLAFGATIWIPLAIWVEGDIIRLFDPCKHVEAPLGPADTLDPLQLDRRWIRIRRPTIIVGGELTLDQLEIAYNPYAGLCEAPLQLKSNCGTLLIDDLGRQRVSPTDLLNRWIVPLERRHDYLNLPSGRTIQLPFDQLLVFSTNLEPRDLVDEAFLRRLPYKIEIPDPTEAEFRELFRVYGERLGVTYCAAAVEHLIARHFRGKRRPFRFCQARDLTIQVRNYCGFNRLPIAMTPQAFDVAVHNYFALMG
jgi:hypothetical protein